MLLLLFPSFLSRSPGGNIGNPSLVHCIEASSRKANKDKFALQEDAFHGIGRLKRRERKQANRPSQINYQSLSPNISVGQRSLQNTWLSEPRSARSVLCSRSHGHLQANLLPFFPPRTVAPILLFGICSTTSETKTTTLLISTKHFTSSTSKRLFNKAFCCGRPLLKSRLIATRDTILNLIWLPFLPSLSDNLHESLIGEFHVFVASDHIQTPRLPSSEHHGLVKIRLIRAPPPKTFSIRRQ